MRKITSKSEANEFYKIVNSHIDDYINNWKVDPKNLKKYFSNKNKRQQFLSRTGLDDVERINTILDDVLEDREAMIHDNIMSFESFFLSESISIEAPGFEHEKVIADLYKTSLSHIEVKDKQKNHFVVDDLGEKHEVCVFSNKDLESFREQIKELLVKEANESDLDIYQIEIENKRQLKTKLKFKLADIIDDQKLEKQIEEALTENKLLAIMTTWLNNADLVRSRKKFNYLKSSHNFFIWELKNS